MYVPMEEPLLHQPMLQLPPHKVTILVVENDGSTREQLIDSLRSNRYRATGAETAEEALFRLAEQRFDLVFMSLALRDMNGFRLLGLLRERYQDTTVIVCSAFQNSSMARRAIAEGAADYVMTPCNPLELPVTVERNLTRSSLSRRREMDYRIDLQRTYRGLLETLLAAIDQRDRETEGHSERVAAYTMLIAERMQLELPELIHIERGALLHDIGKIGIPDRILHKAGPLTDDEWVVMKRHPEIGYDICRRIEALSEASSIVLHHHERFDGRGYPWGIAGDEIPLGARIFAIVDTFDAITSDRPYRMAQPTEVAFEEITRCSGTQFDPEVVQVFRDIPTQVWRDVRTMIMQEWDSQAEAA